MAKNVATVEDFEKLKNDVGLVPMTFLKPTIGEFKGDVRGAEPYTALRWYNEGLAEPVGNLKATGDAGEKKQAGETGENARMSAIDLGTDPLNGHRLTKIALAKKITGSNDSITEEDANRVIQAEIDRRAASVPGGGLTTHNTVTR